MTEDEALDALATAIAAADGETERPVVIQYRHHAKVVRNLLRAHPEQAAALGIGAPVAASPYREPDLPVLLGPPPRPGLCGRCAEPMSAHEYGVFCR